jgi:hypothetical protein
MSPTIESSLYPGNPGNPGNPSYPAPVRRRWAAALAVAALVAGALAGAAPAAPASAVSTMTLVDAVTDNYKTWDGARNINVTSFLFTGVTIGGTTYVVPNARRATAPGNGAPFVDAQGVPLATSPDGPVSAHLTFTQPEAAATDTPFYRLFPSGVFGVYTSVDKATFQAGATPLQFPITVSSTAGDALGSLALSYRHDPQIAALPESSLEWGGPEGRWYVGDGAGSPTPLNWPKSLTISSSTGSAHQSAITVPAGTTTNLYVTPVDIAGLPVPRFGNFDNQPVDIGLQWNPGGAGRPVAASGPATSRPVPVTLPAGSYTVSASAVCNGYCEVNYPDTPLSSPSTTITAAAAATYRPDALVRPAGGAYLGDGVYNTSGASQTVSAEVTAGTTGTFDVQLQNDGTATDSWTLAQAPGAAIAGFAHSWQYNGSDVTGAVNGGSLGITGVPTGSTRQLTFAVTPAAGTAAGTVATYYLHVYHSGSATKDVIGIKVTTKAAGATPVYRPDALVRPTGGTYVGDGVYGTNGSGQTVAATVAAGAAGTFEVQLQNDGNASDSWTVAGSPSSPIAGFSHYWGYNGTGVTSAVNGGSLSIPNVEPGGSRLLTFSARPAASTAPGTVATYYLHVYHSGSSTKDVIGIRITTGAAQAEFITSTPTIVGTARVGTVLTAKRGSWTPSTASFVFTWKTGATTLGTGSTYTPKPGDAGKTLTVTVTATMEGYTTTSRTSAATAAVAPGALTRGTPVISGTARVGSALTATIGTWKPAPVTTTLQWMRDGTAIAGATTATRTLTADDLGSKITVVVTGQKTGYTTTSASSAATAAVTPGVLTAPQPSIVGTAKVGQKLTVSQNGTWSPAPVALSYRWLANGVAISGATKSAFYPTTAQKGATITVKVIGTKAGYTTLSRVSAPTAAVVQ